MSRVGWTLTLGLTLVAIALGVTLSRSPMVTIRRSTSEIEQLTETQNAAGACQAGETLPAGTSAIRLALMSDAGPYVSVRALSAGRVLIAGVAHSGWTGGSVTMPVRPLNHTISHIRICFRLGPTKERVAIVGEPTSPVRAARSDGGGVLPGRLRVEYLQVAPSSWWSTAVPVARRIGLGRAPSGTWIALLVLSLMIAVVCGASWLSLRDLR